MSDNDLTAEEFAQLKKENSKLKLEANLRRSLSTQLEKQKKLLTACCLRGRNFI